MSKALEGVVVLDWTTEFWSSLGTTAYYVIGVVPISLFLSSASMTNMGMGCSS